MRYTPLKGCNAVTLTLEHAWFVSVKVKMMESVRIESGYGYLNQPYIQPMLKLAQKVSGKDGVYHVMIEHDDWCPVLSGTGYCVCRPVVRMANRKERRKFAQAEKTARV